MILKIQQKIGYCVPLVDVFTKDTMTVRKWTTHCVSLVAVFTKDTMTVRKWMTARMIMVRIIFHNLDCDDVRTMH